MREVKEPAHFCKIYHLAEEGLINNGPAVYTIVNIVVINVNSYF